MSVVINACRLLSALPSLSQFGLGRLSLVAISFYALSLLFGPCHLLEFTLAGPPETYGRIAMASFAWKKCKTACHQAGSLRSTESKTQKYRRINSKTLCNIETITFKFTRVSGALFFYYANIKVNDVQGNNKCCVHHNSLIWWSLMTG